MIHKLPEVEDHARIVPLLGTPFETIRRDSIEPVPIGTLIAMIFRVTGYDQDCDGSLMARMEQVDQDGETTGWDVSSIGLYPGSDVILDTAGDLHNLIAQGSGAHP